MIGKSVGSIVSDKQIQELIAVPASATVSEAVSRMSEKGVGAILIRNSQSAVDGIFTERDLMIRVVNEGRDAKTTAIGTVMTSQVGRVEGWTSLEDALSLMVVHGYRHLLVEDAAKITPGTPSGTHTAAFGFFPIWYQDRMDKGWSSACPRRSA